VGLRVKKKDRRTVIFFFVLWELSYGFVVRFAPANAQKLQRPVAESAVNLNSIIFMLLS
jgi:hypothetical protein